MKLTACYTLFLSLVLLAACEKAKEVTPAKVLQLSYGDSVFYLKASDYTISPTRQRTGVYTAYPEDLNIDPNNGNIRVTLKGKDGENTQTGLRYRIVFTPNEGLPDTTHIVLAGINYQDRIYHLAQNESTVNPIYNANISAPVAAGSFSSSDKKLAIDAATGQIDLKKTVTNSFFHNNPRDGDWEVITINYKTTEQGTAQNNSLDVVVYFYESVEKIPSNVSAAMRAHQHQLLGIPPAAIPETKAPIDDEIKNIVSVGKPRPPCIILIGRP